MKIMTLITLLALVIAVSLGVALEPNKARGGTPDVAQPSVGKLLARDVGGNTGV